MKMKAAVTDYEFLQRLSKKTVFAAGARERLARIAHEIEYAGKGERADGEREAMSATVARASIAAQFAANVLREWQQAKPKPGRFERTAEAVAMLDSVTLQPIPDND